LYYAIAVSMFNLRRHFTASPNTTTILADGYTDDALNSKYDNHRKTLEMLKPVGLLLFMGKISDSDDVY
ncbi:hypothetical protein ANCDUO_12130, partial [Ancylostoma duodenale]